MAASRRNRSRTAASPASPRLIVILLAATTLSVLFLTTWYWQLREYKDAVAAFQGDVDKISRQLNRLIRMEQERRTDASLIRSYSREEGTHLEENHEVHSEAVPALAPASTTARGAAAQPYTMASGHKGNGEPRRIYIFTYGGPPAWSPPVQMPLGFCLGMESALQQELMVEVLGPSGQGKADGKKFSDPKALKPFVLLTRLKELPPDGLMLFNDALDVWFTPHSSEDAFVDAFEKELQIPDDTILVSAERNCWPPADRMPYCRDYPPNKHGTTYKYANTGGWMGRVKTSVFLLQAWTACILDGKDEQGCVQWFYRDALESRKYREGVGAFKIALDDTQRVWQTLWGTKFANAEPAFRQVDAAGFGEEESGKLVNPETSTKPLVAHFNGPKDTLVYWMKVPFLGAFDVLKWRKYYQLEPTFQEGKINFWGETRDFYKDICPHNFLPRLPSKKVPPGQRWRSDYKCSEVCLGKDWRCAADTRSNPPKAPEVTVDGTPLARGGVMAECDPSSASPCCSSTGWCGGSSAHCDCPDCIDYRKVARMRKAGA
ncbi:hypothetical protein FOZ61_000885 [Perkinsus olseni]|uniref:PLOD1-3-like GT domain-containing protein n=1 Tax=Perkinsus olseni TaxID=32597 RepID=A0A7J6LYH3_PEROL|nr:hypothetical protein FOZ61_000885 [Perkinsus olseni]